MRCVIYLRVSTKEQAEKDLTEEGFSIAAQREVCVRRIRDEGWELADEYVDKGESARTADRPRLRARGCPVPCGISGSGPERMSYAATSFSAS